MAKKPSTKPRPVDFTEVKRLFFPHAYDKEAEVRRAGARFAYYTSAETASRMLSAKEFWLRNATAMNDFSEVAYGAACLDEALKGGLGKRLNVLLEACFPGSAQELHERFQSWLPLIGLDTYIVCVSEHSASEDNLGRLSMWRAYGGTNGVALVLNGNVMFSPSTVLGAYSSPVFYADVPTFVHAFDRMITGLEESKDRLISWGHDIVLNSLFVALRFAVLCTKHPGFHEEREWRVVASPSMHPSKVTTTAVEIVRGIPQLVLKIPMKDRPKENLVGLAPATLIDRVIIGPTQFPVPLFRAFQTLLERAKVPNAAARIARSGIPLRQL